MNFAKDVKPGQLWKATVRDGASAVELYTVLLLSVKPGSQSARCRVAIVHSNVGTTFAGLDVGSTFEVRITEGNRWERVA
jgi:hypothetical protein